MTLTHPESAIPQLLSPDAREYHGKGRRCDNQRCRKPVSGYQEPMPENAEVTLCYSCQEDLLDLQVEDPQMNLAGFIGKSRRYSSSGVPGVRIPGLRAVREARGLTRHGLADEAGFTYSSVDKWEKNGMGIVAEKLEHLARVLECSVEDLQRSA